MPVCHKKILPAVVVIVEEYSSPSHVRKAVPHARFRGYVNKETVSQVAVESVGVLCEVCNEEIQVAIIIIVSNRDTHTRLFDPVFINGNTSDQTDLRKCSIAPVSIK